MKYDTQVTLTAAGSSRTLQVCIDYELALPDPGNGSKLDIDIRGAHVFAFSAWMPWPRFMDLLSEDQRVAMLTEMFEAACAAKGLPVLERAHA